MPTLPPPPSPDAAVAAPVAIPIFDAPASWGPDVAYHFTCIDAMLTKPWTEVEVCGDGADDDHAVPQGRFWEATDRPRALIDAIRAHYASAGWRVSGPAYLTDRSRGWLQFRLPEAKERELAAEFERRRRAR